MTHQFWNTENPLRDPRWRPCIRAMERSPPTSATTYCLHKNLADAIRTLIQFDSYRPELHYMRGPGPKWYAKHDLTLALIDGAIGDSRNDNECCAPRQRLRSPMLASSYKGKPASSTKNVDVRNASNEARPSATLAVKRAESRLLQTFKNWPNSKIAAICAGVLSVLFLLSIATLLTVSSSSSVNADPPGKGCAAVSQGEYQGAYRKKLLLTRFGTYERTGRLGQYYYWYCR
jgi:hypothetical protein